VHLVFPDLIRRKENRVSLEYLADPVWLADLAKKEHQEITDPMGPRVLLDTQASPSKDLKAFLDQSDLPVYLAWMESKVQVVETEFQVGQEIKESEETLDYQASEEKVKPVM